MSKIKYLVVAELCRKGFLVGWRNSMKGAELLKDKVYKLGDKYSWNDLEMVEGELDYFDRYTIRGNETYASRVETGISDGKFSVQVFRITQNDEFNVEQFKKERENISTVYPYDGFEEKLFKIYELIEHTSFVAN